MPGTKRPPGQPLPMRSPEPEPLPEPLLVALAPCDGPALAAGGAVGTVDVLALRAPDRWWRARAIGCAVLGNALEHYDTTAYAFFVDYLSPHFFPSSDAGASTVYGYLVFGTTYIVRPLGGVLLAYYADQRGRKPVLIALLVGMAVSTGVTGLVPSWGSIGAAAPALLVLLRLAQAVCVGGLYGSMTTFLAEFAPPGRVGLYTSFQMVAQGVAPVLANLVALALLAVAGEAEVHRFWWRAPFVLGFLTLPLSYYVYRRVAETPAYSRMKMAGKPGAATDSVHRGKEPEAGAVAGAACQTPPVLGGRPGDGGEARRTTAEAFCKELGAGGDGGGAATAAEKPGVPNENPETREKDVRGRNSGLSPVGRGESGEEEGTAGGEEGMAVQFPAGTAGGKGAAAATVARAPRIYDADTLCRILCGCGVIVVGTVSYYAVTVYLPQLLQKSLALSDSRRTILALASPAFAGLAAPLGGWLSDRHGRRGPFAVSVAAYLTAFLALFLLVNFVTRLPFAVAFLSCAVVGFFMGIHWGGQPALMAESFPPRIRTTAVAIPYNLTTVVVGALTPTYLSLFEKWWGHAEVNVAVYVVASGCVSLLALLFWRPSKVV